MFASLVLKTNLTDVDDITVIVSETTFIFAQMLNIEHLL